jgi:DNA-binding transcriptional regulator YdaS (Cro superfamily)
MTTKLTPLEKACLIAGSQAALARMLSVTPPVVNEWIRGRRPIPFERCLEIEKATGRQVQCEELRPDLDWAYLRGTLQGAA